MPALSQGFERALAAGAREVAIFPAASEAFSHRNLNCSISDSFKRYGEVTAAAKDAGLPVRGYVSCSVGCPYEVGCPAAGKMAVTVTFSVSILVLPLAYIALLLRQLTSCYASMQ